VGRFTSQDGKLVIQYDTGELAGEYGRAGKSETLTEGSRVRISRAIPYDVGGHEMFFSMVAFPDSGCANFYLQSPNQDASVIDFIAESFRPKGWTPFRSGFARFARST
jgi:hypothetical protein